MRFLSVLLGKDTLRAIMIYLTVGILFFIIRYILYEYFNYPIIDIFTQVVIIAWLFCLLWMAVTMSCHVVKYFQVKNRIKSIVRTIAWPIADETKLKSAINSIFGLLIDMQSDMELLYLVELNTIGINRNKVNEWIRTATKLTCDGKSSNISYKPTHDKEIIKVFIEVYGEFKNLTETKAFKSIFAVRWS